MACKGLARLGATRPGEPGKARRMRGADERGVSGPDKDWRTGAKRDEAGEASIGAARIGVERIGGDWNV